MDQSTWILIIGFGIAAAIVFAGDHIIKKLREKSDASADRRRNAERIAKGPTQDENLADRFKH